MAYGGRNPSGWQLVRPTLTKKIGFLLLLPFLGSLAGVFALASHLSSTRNHDGSLNVAGRQRMLAAELRDWVHMVALGQEEDRVRLRSVVVEFDKALGALRRGGRVLDDFVDAAPAELPELSAVVTLWDELRPDLLTVAEAPRMEPRFTDAYRRVENRLPELSALAHRFVTALMARHRRQQVDMVWTLGLIAAAVSLVFLAGLLVTRRYIARPVIDVESAARRIEAGDYSSRLEVTTRDELGMLARTFNRMTEQVERLLCALELRRKHAETIINSVPAWLLVLREDLTVVRVNRSFRDCFALDERAVAGKGLTDVLPAEGLAEAALEVLASGEPRRGLRAEMPWKDGKRALRATIAGTRLADEAAEERLLIVAIEDVTEEERLAAEVRALERRFQEVVEQATDGIILMGQDGLITYFNGAAERMFGWRREEVLGQSVAVLKPEGGRAAQGSGLARCLDTGRSAVAGAVSTSDGLRRDGTVFPIECTSSTCLVDGEVVFTGVLRDVTERRRSEEALRRSEASFRALIEHAPDAIIVHRQGRIVYVNAAAAEFLGYGGPGELVGLPVVDFVHPDDREAVANRIRVMLETGEPVPPSEQRFVRKDGGIVTGEVVALPLPFDDKPAIVVLARDVTARRELTAKMMQMDRMIAMGTLAAGVGHEINNPLAYVVGNLSFIACELPDLVAAVGKLEADLAPHEEAGSSGPRTAPPQDASKRLVEIQHGVDEAREGAERVQRIVRDLRTFARAEEDRREPMALERVLESAISMAWNEIRHRARLVKDYGPVPYVEASESRLGQVFLNLLVNAAQAIPEGRAERNEIRVVTRTDETGRAVVEVRDTGSGMSPEVLGRIFDPFFTTKPVGEGTGLGLSICQGIVRGLGGEIVVESEVGKGSSFRVLLPRACAEVVEKRPAAPVAAATPARAGRVLVVDDEPIIGTLLRRILGRNHEVVTATRGREALERLDRGERYDVVLCDLMMPEMTGVDLHAEIARRFPELAPRMVFLTGGAFTPRTREFLDRVPNQRIEKPFDAQNVCALVGGFIR